MSDVVKPKKKAPPARPPAKPDPAVKPPAPAPAAAESAPAAADELTVTGTVTGGSSAPPPLDVPTAATSPPAAAPPAPLAVPVAAEPLVVEEEPLPTKAAAVAEDELPPDNFTQLQLLREARQVTVVEFRDRLGLGREARYILDTYVAQGLVERVWRDGKGRYSLTAAGLRAIA